MRPSRFPASPRPLRVGESRALTLLLAALALFPLAARAQTTWTNTGDGDWLAAENWNPVAVPASSTDVVIDNGGTAILSTPPDPNQNQTDDLIVGQNGTGHLIVQSGGQLISIGNVDIGQNAGGVGTVRVAGTHSLWLLNHSLNVGPAGQGTLTVADGGKVDVGQLQILLGGLGGTATVNIGEGGAAGTLLATSVNGSGGPAAVVFNHTDALAFAPQLTGALSVTKLGAGTLTFSGATANTYSDGTTLAGGTLAIDSDDKLGGGALAFDGGTLTITQDVSMPERPISLDAGGGTFDIPLDTTLSQSGVIDGTGALTKLGAGTLVLAGENAYTGVTAANGGTLVVAGALTTGGLGVGRVASATAAVVVSGTLQVTGGSPSFITVGDKADSHGTLTIEDGGLVSLASGAKLTVGWEDATGTLNLDDGGTLQVGGTDGIQKHASGTTDFNLAGGTLQVANNPLTTSVPMTLAEDTTSTIDTHGFGATFSGALAGDGALVKTGDGTLVLAGDNTYTGATLVSAGTLAVNGSLSAGTTVTVADGATLAGSGTIAGNVIAADGSTTAPGDGLGTLTIGGDYTWTAGATLAFALSGSDDASDQLAITGALAKGGSGTFAFDFGGTGQPGTTYTLATFDSQSGFAADASDFSYTNAGGPAGTFALVDGTKLTFTTALRPILTGVSPQLGSSNGGTTVTLTGAAFVDGQTTVAFGGSAGTNVTVQSPTSLTVTAPAGSPGASVDVTVTTPHGTSATSAADRFTYIPLAVGTDAELRNAILYAAPGDTIGLTGDITLTADLPAVQAGVTIDGGGFTLDGDNIYRGFFTYSASDRITVTIANLSIRHTWALGGAGGNSDAWTTGGGGAGLGGAVFVHANVDLVLRNVTIDGSSAAGGAGGIDSNPLYAGGAYGNGGGGGLGGAGGNATALNGGGGGIGRLAVGGGNDHAAGNSTIVPGADGGAASSAYDTPSGGGGVQPSGTMGGFGGGGGSVSIGTGTAGSGGFGGGGGSGAVGGAGGFGGGGGGSYSGSAAGGFGGGNGSRFGGGGLGAGGAIFVQQGGSLTLSGPLTIDGSTVTGGAGAGAGSAFGAGLFIQGDGTITFSPNAGETQTIDDGIADQTGSGGIDSNAGAGALTKLGDGTLVLAGANTYTGATLVSAGTLTVNGSLAAETTVTIADGATLAGSGTIAGDVIAADGSTIAPGSLGTLTIGGDYTWTAGATLAFALSGSDDASNQLAITGALTKSGSGTFAFDFGGTGQPGTTYTLATFATTDFAFDASDFSYTNAGGPAGTFALVDGTQLTFTTSSNNADLSALALSAGTLSPAFARGTFGYAADVPNATDSVTVTPTLADPTASVTVNGTGVVSGTASGPIALAVGANPITVLVTAQDGTTTRTTTITVTRAAVSVTPDLPASIVFGNLHFTYDGTAKPATATTEPAGLTVAFTYNGSSTPPTDAGSYAVRARILTSGYTGSATSTLTIAPAIAAAPTATTAKLGGPATLTGDAAGGANVTYQWRRNGVDLPGATGPTLTIEHTAPGDAGLYSVVVTADGVATETESESAPLALTFTGKLAGDGMEVGTDIVHPNGNVYDQILLTGPAVSVKADPGQVTRVSYVDLSDDIVQVELAGAGTLTLSLTDASGPAEAVNYHQPDVAYMKGHATIFVSGADATTNLTIFSVGRITAVDQSLFRDDVAYDGVADVALVEIASADGTFGGLRAANAGFSEVKGWTGVHAPGVQFAGPVYVGNLRASDDATPVLLLGAVDDARIAGGDLAQDNGRPVGVSGLVKLHFVDGMTSHGVLLPAQRNAGVLEEDGADVTDRIVVNPE